MGLITTNSNSRQCKEIFENYTLNEGDYENVLIFNSFTDIVCTIPVGLRIGFFCTVIQKGNSVITFDALAVKINGFPESPTNSALWEWVNIVCIAKDEFAADFGNFGGNGGGGTSPIPNLQQVLDQGFISAGRNIELDNNRPVGDGELGFTVFADDFGVRRPVIKFPIVKLFSDVFKRGFLRLSKNIDDFVTFSTKEILDGNGAYEISLPSSPGNFTLPRSVNGVNADNAGNIQIPIQNNANNSTQTGAITFNTSDGANSWKILTLPILDQYESPPTLGSYYCTGFVDLKASVLALDPNLTNAHFLFLEKLAFIYNPFVKSTLEVSLVHGGGFIETELQNFNYYRKDFDNIYVFSAKYENNSINVYLEKTQYAIDNNISLTEAVFNVQYSYSFIKQLFVTGGNNGGGGGEERTFAKE